MKNVAFSNNREREHLVRLTDCFLGFTSDPDRNIQRITECCGKLMSADWALYNRIQDEMLHTLAKWNAPSCLRTVTRPEGRICHDVIKKGGKEVFVALKLPQSRYAETAPMISSLGIETYIGAPVSMKDLCVGSLCLFYKRDYAPDEGEKKILQILAAALGVEEERRFATIELRRSNEELENRVRERTAELARVNDILQADIMERKEAEESLRKSESILRKIFEATPDMLAVIDRDCRVIHCNWHGHYEHARELFHDRSPHCYQAFHPEQKGPCTPCHALDVFKTGKPVLIEETTSRHGEIEVRAYPIFDDTGNVVMVAELIRDITKRKRDDAALLEKNEKLNAITDTARDAIIIMDDQGEISFWNTAAQNIFGYTPSEALGKDLHTFLAPPEFHESFRKEFFHFKESGLGKAIGKTIELRAVRKGGAEFSVELSLSAFQVGDKWHAAGILRDITIRKEREEKLRAANEELLERSRQLLDAQEELVRKEKLAILGQLSGSVGHELRNPLGVMTNAIYFLRSVIDDGDGMVREYLDIIKQEIDNSLRIITDLLDFARTIPPCRQVVVLSELLDETLGRCVVPGYVAFSSEIPEDLPPLQVDPQQIGQVFQNLITNAVQAMSEGGTLTVSARSSSKMVEISFTDTGEGISPENMKKLFQPLFTTKARGIGLGLTVCRNLVEANGGRIEVRSRIGEGTAFTVELPVMENLI